jgi:glycosyltransferase involved in cell wall biosynthesis
VLADADIRERLGTAARVRFDLKLPVVTLIDTPHATGGAEHVALSIARRLDPERFESIICATRLPAQATSGRDAVATPSFDDVRLVALGRSATMDLAAWRPLVTLLRDERVAVLHSHMFGSNVWGTLIGRLARVPVVVAHEHGWGVDSPTRLRRLLDRSLIGPGTDAFVAVSDATRNRMVEVARLQPEKIVVIPNGIPAAPAEPRHDVRAELGIPSSVPVIGTVAKLRQEKAVDILLRSAAHLRERFPGLRVLIAGHGPERLMLERLCDALELRDTVMFLGVRRDVPDVLAALDVAAFSSISEGSPLSVLEAMEAALPIVATRVGGVPELVEHGVHGMLVEPQDVAALTEGVARMLENRPLGAAMGLRAKARRRREFDVDVMVRRIEQLYEDLHVRSARQGGHASARPASMTRVSGAARRRPVQP